MKFTSIFISILQQSIDEWWRIHRSNYTGYFSQKKKKVIYIKKDKICWNISSGFSWICPPGIFSGFFPRIIGLNIFPEFSFVADFFCLFFAKKCPVYFNVLPLNYVWFLLCIFQSILRHSLDRFWPTFWPMELLWEQWRKNSLM